jgi:hypothetical protein
MYDDRIGFWDWLLLPFYLIIIYVIALRFRDKENPVFKYFISALLMKILGAIGLCLIYVYYYRSGGDTLNYNDDSSALLKLFYYSSSDFFKVWLSPLSRETNSYFTIDTGYLIYSTDSNAFMVDRLLVPLKFISFDSYIISSVLMGALSFTGVWKLYTVFCDYYPYLYKHFAVTVLFVPSVIFWGSGLLKDSWTLAAAGWFCYSFHNLFIKRVSFLSSSIFLTISILLMIAIKPYIFLGLFPGALLWVSWSRLNKIQSVFVKIIVAPIVLVFGVAGGFFIWSLASSSLGQYSSFDGILNKASVSYLDLQQDYYQGSAFDIGFFEPTMGGILSKFPIATATGLFRPFMWEARNVVMIASGIENMLILIFVLFVFVRKPWVAINSTFSNPLVLFCLIFALFFAFSVALSTSNFGALVRLRIPMIPFFLSGLVMIEYAGRSKKNNQRQLRISGN